MFHGVASRPRSFLIPRAVMSRVRSIPVLFSAFALVLAGCGPGEDKLYDLSGSLTYEGKPIARGVIHFEPDAHKGNKDVAGYAEIHDGKYDTTQRGKGIKGGAYSIRINGFDGKVGPEAPFGTALFPEYSETRALKPENQTLDIDAKKKK
jgi:hypothetical protein